MWLVFDSLRKNETIYMHAEARGMDQTKSGRTIGNKNKSVAEKLQH